MRAPEPVDEDDGLLLEQCGCSLRRVTTQAQGVGSRDAGSPLTKAAQLHASTDWAVSGHSSPFEFDLANTLALLLHDNPATRTKALRDLQSAVHHANTISPSTTPVALYIAALLSDPRTEEIDVIDRHTCPRPMRAALLDWLGEMASDVGEESITALRRVGFPITAEEAALRAARPTLVLATTAFTGDHDADIRHAAVTATLLLLDTREECRSYQTEYAPLVEDILATSSNRFHRARALDSLDAWGHDTRRLRRVEPAPVGEDASAWSDEPPF